MRQGQQHRRGRGRNNNNNNNNNNNRRGHNPLARSFESNGPDVKVRGTPADIASKYLSLARDAQSSGDPVLAENYFQHAEHYNRIIMAYREQQGQQQPQDGMNGNPQRFRQDNQSFGEQGDEFSDDESSDNPGLGDQPDAMNRHSQEQPRQAEGYQRQHEQRQHDDGGRPQHRQHEHNQQRFNRNERGDRGDREHRFQRHDRGERHDRGDRGNRPERHERGERHGQDRGYDRPQHDQVPERSTMERPPTSERGPIERSPIERPPVERAPIERLPVERAMDDHEVRMPRARPVVEEQPVLPPVAEAPAVPPPARAEGAPRRRERYGLGNDQPEFLRRPVRRPRREAEAPATPPPATDETPSQD